MPPLEDGGFVLVWPASRCCERMVAVEDRRNVWVAPFVRARDLSAPKSAPPIASLEQGHCEVIRLFPPKSHTNLRSQCFDRYSPR